MQYLGVTIDEHLTWTEHINNLSLKLCQTNGILSKLRHYVPQKNCISIYYALFYSHILHGCLVWQYTSKTNRSKLEKLQKKCLRIMTFSNFDAPSNPLFAELNILKLDDICTSQVILFCHDFFMDFFPSALKNLFVLTATMHTHETRSSKQLFIPKFNTAHYGSNSLFYIGPVTWNSFFKCLVEIEFRQTFTKKYRTFGNFFSTKNFYEETL